MLLANLHYATHVWYWLVFRYDAWFRGHCLTVFLRGAWLVGVGRGWPVFCRLGAGKWVVQENQGWVGDVQATVTYPKLLPSALPALSHTSLTATASPPALLSTRWLSSQASLTLGAQHRFELCLFHIFSQASARLPLDLRQLFCRSRKLRCTVLVAARGQLKSFCVPLPAFLISLCMHWSDSRSCPGPFPGPFCFAPARRCASTGLGFTVLANRAFHEPRQAFSSTWWALRLWAWFVTLGSLKVALFRRPP